MARVAQEQLKGRLAGGKLPGHFSLSTAKVPVSAVIYRFRESNSPGRLVYRGLQTDLLHLAVKS